VKARLGLFALISFVSLAAQTSSPTDVIQGVAAAFAQRNISQVTLGGIVATHYGSDDKGTFTASINQEGALLEVSVGNSRKEYQATDAFACYWSDADGNQHKQALHNCSLPLSWVLPAFNVQSVASAEEAQLSATNEPQKGVINLQIKKSPVSAAQKFDDHLQFSQFSLELDATTYLPSAAVFQTHPDNNENLSIPVRVEYSDYRDIDGVKLPFSIKRFINGTLVIELTVQTAGVQ
jgi:hypothetical protein